MRLRIALLTALLVGSLVLAGCTATQEREARTTEATTTRATEVTTTGTTATTTGTTAATATTASYLNCPYHLSVESAREEQISRVDETLTYRELPPERRREFDAALGNGSAELGTELPATWERPRIVRYRGDRYYTVASVC